MHTAVVRRPRPHARLASLAAAILAAAPSVAPSVAAGQVNDVATAAEPEAVITLDRYRTRWTLTATVGGKPRKLLFDTGGGLTLASAAVLAEAGCRLWGRVTGHNMFGARGEGPRCEGVAFTIGGRAYTPAVTGPIELGTMNPADSTLDGLASLSLFEGRTLTLDLAAGRIVVESPASFRERVRTMTPLPARIVHEVMGLATAVMVGVPSARGTLWMELDSGNGGTVLVSKPVAALVGLDSTRTDKQTADFAVAPGIRARTEDAYTPSLIYDGNLGMPFLRHWVVTVDLGAGRAWIAPAPGDAAAGPAR